MSNESCNTNNFMGAAAGSSPVSYPVQPPTTIAENELINLVRDFVLDETLKSRLEYYLKYNPLTPKATHKLISFLCFSINVAVTVSNIPTREDARKLNARYKLQRALLPNGLTKFDMTDTYLHILAGIDHCYTNQLFRAAQGFTMKQIHTHTLEQKISDSRATSPPSEEEGRTLRKLILSR